MEKSFYCPDCNHKLELMSGCGSVSYFCNNCKMIISRKRILSEDEVEEKVAKKVEEVLKKQD
jgi:DNA-directed RNA polymerase subunit RPC12/RpoP